jgi:hypothetical protein
MHLADRSLITGGIHLLCSSEITPAFLQKFRGGLQSKGELK